MKLSEFHLKLLPYGNSTVHTCLYIINLFGIYSVSINWFVHAVNHQEALRMDSAGMRRGSCLPQGTYKAPVLSGENRCFVGVCYAHQGHSVKTCRGLVAKVARQVQGSER